jgi:hypothetical protein
MNETSNTQANVIDYDAIASALYSSDSVTVANETPEPETSDKQTSLFMRKTLKAKDFQICEGIIAFLGKARVTRQEMMSECKSRGRKYPPYWTFKNVAVHVKGTNLYDLSRLKLAAKEVRLDPALIERVTAKKSKRPARATQVNSHVIVSDPLPSIAQLSEPDAELAAELALV